MDKTAAGMAQTTLLATVHDPSGRMVAALDERGARLRGYARVHVTVTSGTDERVRGRLVAWGASIVSGAPDGVGGSMRALLRAASAERAPSSFYCDFDRWLHWAGAFPQELDAFPDTVAARFPDAWYVCVGRTARAFGTHPEVQRIAEAATNRALALAAGRRLDATGGSCWVSRAGAALILERSCEPTKATDLEWPALILAGDPARLAGSSVEGLEFETAEFYAPEIAAAGGLEAWLRETYDAPQMWRDRLRLAADSVAALSRILSR